MTTAKDYAKQAVASLGSLLPPGTDTRKLTAVIRGVLAEAEASVQARTSRLLSASPAVIYKKRGKAEAVEALEAILSRLKE